jgi:hypothetical protein
MTKTEVLADQSPLHMQIFVERSLDEFSKDFLATGPDTVSIAPGTVFTAPASLGPNAMVPLIRAAHGRALFERGKWGHHRADGPVEHFRRCTGQSLGYPCLIPASAIDLTGRGGTVRVTDPDGGNLYVGAIYFQQAPGASISVVPLYCEAGPDIAPYSPWQPLLMPVSALPRSGVLAFLDPQDGALHLRRGSPRQSLAVGVL